MPSSSKAQQRAAGMAHAAKKGELDPKTLKGPAKQMYDDMDDEQLRSFAKTKHAGKPEHVEEASTMPHTNVIKGSFTQAQLNALKASYEKIDRVDPSSKSYKELINWLDMMPNSMLKQLERAKIKFLSNLARNRIGMNENISPIIEETPRGFNMGQKVKSKHMSNTVLTVSEVPRGKDWVYVTDKKGHEMKIKISDLTLTEGTINELSHETIKGHGNAVDSHKKALDGLLQKYGGKAKEETPLFHRISGGKRRFTVLTKDFGGKIESIVIYEGTSSGALAYEKDSADPYPAPKLPSEMNGPTDVEGPNIEDEDPEFGRYQRARLEGKKSFAPVLDENQDEETTDEDKIIDPEEAEEELDETQSGDVWKHLMGKGKFEVRGTVGNTSNEKVGAYATKEEAIKVAKKTKNGKVVNMVSNETIYEAYQQQFKPGPPPNQVKRDEKERKTWVVTYVTADRKTKEIKLTARDHHEADMLAHEKLGRDPNVGRITGVKLAEADMAVAGLHKNRSMWEDTEDNSEKDGIDSSELIGQEDDTTDGVTEGRYAFKPNQSIKYQSKSWTVKQATKDWVELEDKRGYTTIVDFDDIRDFTDGNLMVERDIQLHREQQERMLRAAGLSKGNK